MSTCDTVGRASPCTVLHSSCSGINIKRHWSSWYPGYSTAEPTVLTIVDHLLHPWLLLSENLGYSSANCDTYKVHVLLLLLLLQTEATC